MRQVAAVNIFVNSDGHPVVQFEGDSEFVSMSPVHRAMLAMSAIRMCSGVIEHLKGEFPDLADDIQQGVEAVEIGPQDPAAMN